MDWGEEDYSIVVQDEEGKISRFSIFVDFLYSFDVECSEIEITNILPPLISHVSDVEAIEQK